jgi:hypothetical protein
LVDAQYAAEAFTTCKSNAASHQDLAQQHKAVGKEAA